MKPFIDKKYNIFYKTLCIPTGEYYFGIHSTDNLSDGYIGSGRGLLESFSKHKRTEYRFEILKYFSTREEASEYERQIVTQEMIDDELCINRQTGGSSNVRFSAETMSKLKKTPEQKEKISKSRKGVATIVTPEQRKHQSEMVSGSRNGMYNVERPTEWKEEQSRVQSERYKSGAHQFCNIKGVCKDRVWCHNKLSSESKMVKNGQIPEGWLPGRGTTANGKSKPHKRKVQ